MSALVAFLGGSIFRMIWSEVGSFVKNWQEQRHEANMLRLNADIAKERHAQNIESIRLQSDLNVREIEVRTAGAVTEIETDAWAGVVKATYTPSGVKFIDGWNQSIRPFLATVVIACWMAALYQQGFEFNQWDKDLASAVLGIFIADRIVRNRER